MLCESVEFASNLCNRIWWNKRVLLRLKFMRQNQFASSVKATVLQVDKMLWWMNKTKRIHIENWKTWNRARFWNVGCSHLATTFAHLTMVMSSWCQSFLFPLALMAIAKSCVLQSASNEWKFGELIRQQHVIEAGF